MGKMGPTADEAKDHVLRLTLTLSSVGPRSILVVRYIKYKALGTRLSRTHFSDLANIELNPTVVSASWLLGQVTTIRTSGHGI